MILLPQKKTQKLLGIEFLLQQVFLFIDFALITNKYSRRQIVLMGISGIKSLMMQMLTSLFCGHILFHLAEIKI